MPIIPRYQSRGGPRLQGLDYAGAYQPPGGDDWRMFGKAMETFAPLAQATYNKIQEAKARGSGGGGDSQAEPQPAPDQSAALEGVGGEVAWRDQMNATGGRLDPQAVATSREQFGAGLSEAGRQVFDLATRPREQGFISQARYSGEQAAQARWEALALRREQLGVEEYARLVDIDAEAGRAALGSAIAQRAQRMMASGASSEATQAARRTLVVDAEVARLGHVLRDSPDRAEALLARTGHLLPEAAQQDVVAAIGAERLRLEAQQTAQSLAAELDDAVGNFDTLELRAREAAGPDPARQAAFRGAAAGVWRRAKAELEAREDAAMGRLSQRLKAGGDIASWTDLPTEDWKALSTRQQMMVRGHLQAPWRESDPVAMGLLKDMAARQPGAFKDFDLMTLGDRLSLDDLQDWRAMQREARAGAPGWRRDQAVLAGMARAIDRADGAGGDPAFRGAAYSAFEQAQTLKGGDLSPQDLSTACLELQEDWLKGLGAPSREGEIFGWRPPWSPPPPPPAKPPPPPPTPEPGMRELEPYPMVSEEYGKPRYIPLANPNIGALSEEHESSGRGPDVVSSGLMRGNAPDPGGISYGVYQFPTKYKNKPGRVFEFVTSPENAPWKGRFAGLRPGTPAFGKMWKQIAAEDPEGFRKAQHAFVERTHYRVQIDKVKKDTGLDIASRSYALQDVAWSTSVQHGPSTRVVTSAIAKARKKYGAGFTDEQLIDEIYAERTRVFPIDKPRYDKEAVKARKALADERSFYPDRKAP